MSLAAFENLPEEVLRWILSQRSLGPEDMGPFLACRRTHFAARDVVNGKTDLVVKLNTTKSFPRDQYDFGLYGVADCPKTEVVSGSTVETLQGLYPLLSSRKKVSFVVEMGDHFEATFLRLARLRGFLRNLRKKTLVLECIFPPGASFTRGLEDFRRLLRALPIAQNSHVEAKINARLPAHHLEALENFTFDTENVHSVNYMMGCELALPLSRNLHPKPTFHVSSNLQRLKMTLEHEADLSSLMPLLAPRLRVLEIQSVKLTARRDSAMPFYKKFPMLEDLRLGNLDCSFRYIFPPNSRLEKLQVLHMTFFQKSNLEDFKFKKIAPNLRTVLIVDPKAVSHFSNTSKLA